MLVSVYRVETPRGGCGPYNNEHKGLLEPMFEVHRAGEHPSPVQDDLLGGYISPSEHCGFATLEQLDEWFSGFHGLLAELGFVRVKYVVPVHLVRYGKTQLVFQRGDFFPEATMPMQ